MLLAEELDHRGMFSEIDTWRRNQELFSVGDTDLTAAIRLQSDQYARGLKGLAVSEVHEIALSLASKIHLTSGFESFYHYLRSTGARKVLVTSSPYEALPAILSRFPFDVVFAFRLVTESGRFTGAYSTPMTPDVKRERLTELMAGRRNVGSWGIGDRPEDMETFSVLESRILMGNRSLSGRVSLPFYRVADFDGVLTLLRRGS